MQVKVFKFDKNGKVSFTQAELEKLLNEVYNGGYYDGQRSHNYWTWTSPYLTWSNASNTINCSATLTGNDTTTTVPNPNITWTTTTNSTDNTITATMYTDENNDVKINDCVSYVVNAVAK